MTEKLYARLYQSRPDGLDLSSLQVLLSQKECKRVVEPRGKAGLLDRLTTIGPLKERSFDDNGAYIIRYMLDINIVSDVVAHPCGKVAQRISDVGEFGVSVSAIVAGQLRSRAAIAGHSGQQEFIERLLSRITVLPCGFEAKRKHDCIRDELKNLDWDLEENDLLLAAHAYSLDLYLVTDRVSQFSGIQGLKLENWLS